MKMIVCVDKNFGIGYGNDMPWGRSLKTDLNFFKEKTLNADVIMGSKTFYSIIDSLGKPLPKRNSYVLTTKERTTGYENVHFISNIEEMPKEAIVIGGGSVYSYFLENDLIDEAFVTQIDYEFNCDTFLPNFINEKWVLKEKKEYPISEKDKYKISIMHYKKSI